MSFLVDISSFSVSCVRLFVLNIISSEQSVVVCFLNITGSYSFSLHTFVCYCFDIFTLYFFILNSFVFCCPFHLSTLFACVIIIFRFFFYIVFYCMRVVMFCYWLVFICKKPTERGKKKKFEIYDEASRTELIFLLFYILVQQKPRFLYIEI